MVKVCSAYILVDLVAMVCIVEEVWWEVREIWGFGLRWCCCAGACSHECTREE